MNYWMAEMTGLSSVTPSLFDYIQVGDHPVVVIFFDASFPENMGTARGIYCSGSLQYFEGMGDTR